jgi:hypothetical protein
MQLSNYNSFKCKSVPYTLLHTADIGYPIFPYLRSSDGDKEMYCVSPNHGRSYVMGKLEDGRFVVSKGNGLCYSQYAFLNTRNFGDDTLGLLLRQDAERDFLLGQEIEKLGIKTNHMEYVVELETQITLPSGHKLKPVLLQYDVECSWRICDAPFMTKEQILEEVDKWKMQNNRGHQENYMIAANVLIRNLRILHDNNILHNAIHEQNYTWALELLDFELACSPSHPYISEDDRRHVKDLFPRELTQTYVIINYIAGVLGEKVDFIRVDQLFLEYGFNIKEFEIPLMVGSKNSHRKE